jgi:hypothetical protein
MRRLLLTLTGVSMMMTALLAQSNGVSISNLTTSAGTVTFEVRWNSTAMPPLWLDSAWVFVDYNDNGVTKRLLLDPAGATLTATSALGVGRVAYEPGNAQGVWVIGNARTSGAFYAKVLLPAATASATLAGVCAYASNYPPVGLYTSDTEITFTGTLPYIITLQREDNGQLEIWPQLAAPPPVFTVPSGYTAYSFTDATGAPGRFSYNCAAGEIDGVEEL